MGEFSFIYLLMIGIALCIAFVFILRIMEDKNALNESDKDSITEFIESRRQLLETNMPKLTIRTYLMLTCLSPVVFGIAFWLIFPNKIFATFLAVFGAVLPDFVIRTIIDMRKKKYEEKYVRALKSFSSGMKAGLSIQQSIREVMVNPFVAEEIREGFRQIDADLRVGISIEDAFDSFAEKADNDDARDVASAISMQSAVGGSEAKVIESIAVNIEDRLMTKKKIRSIFASTDFMMKLFDILPFVAVIVMYVGLPDLVGPVIEDIGAMLIVVFMLIFSLVGSIVIRKTIQRAKGE